MTSRAAFCLASRSLLAGLALSFLPCMLAGQEQRALLVGAEVVESANRQALDLARSLVADRALVSSRRIVRSAPLFEITVELFPPAPHRGSSHQTKDPRVVATVVFTRN